MITTPVTAAGEKTWRTVRLEVLEKIKTLPSLNAVVLEFLQLCQREFFTARDFESVIGKDQALAARVLKLANSGMYGRSRSIKSIPEAVVLVGLESLKKIVFAVSTEGLTRRSMQNYAYHHQEGFWLHSLGVAHTCRVLVEAVPGCPLRGEEAYVAGLLHDVGKLVIDDFLPAADGARVTRQDERYAVGLDHAELGEHILGQWNLPESITACVRHHHDYSLAGAWARGAAVLSLAEGVCGHWGLGRRHPVDLSEEIPESKLREVRNYLGLPAGNWDQVVWDIRQNLVGLEGVFQHYVD